MELHWFMSWIEWLFSAMFFSMSRDSLLFTTIEATRIFYPRATPNLWTFTCRTICACIPVFTDTSVNIRCTGESYLQLRQAIDFTNSSIVYIICNPWYSLYWMFSDVNYELSCFTQTLDTVKPHKTITSILRLSHHSDHLFLNTYFF